MTTDPKPASAPEPFISIQSAASMLGLPYFKMRRFLKTGAAPIYNVGNSRQLVRVSEVIEAINNLQARGRT